MVDNLLATMSKMIKDLNWMDEQTKNLAQEKVYSNFDKEIRLCNYSNNRWKIL